MKSMNDTFFKDVFPFKKAQKSYSLKRTIEASSSNNHQL
jgi:hypothetical protein